MKLVMPFSMHKMIALLYGDEFSRKVRRAWLDHVAECLGRGDKYLKLSEYFAQEYPDKAVPVKVAQRILG